MAKQQTNMRLSEEAQAAAERLQGVHAYADRTDAAEAALVCWEQALCLAAEEVAPMFSREEWNMMADICNGTAWAYGHTGSRPGLLLAASVEDGHKLDGAGYRWLIDSDLPEIALPDALRGAADERAAALAAKLLCLDYAQAWAVIRAICWFWQHNDIDWRTDDWWTPAFRRGKGAGA